VSNLNYGHQGPAKGAHANTHAAAAGPASVAGTQAATQAA